MSATTQPIVANRDVGIAHAFWTTPRRIRAYLGVVWCLALIFFVVVSGALDRARRAVGTIGDDAVPSILASQEIGFALTDMDANLANELIGDDSQRNVAAIVVQNRRVIVTQRLVGAAENITFGDADRVPVNILFTDLGDYLQLATQVEIANGRHDQRAAEVAYWQANKLLREEMMPAAQHLDDVKRNALLSAEDSERSSSRFGSIGAAVVGSILVVVLVGLQIYLSRRTRRLLAPALVLATVAAAGVTTFGFVRLSSAAREIEEAKKAFESVHTLIRARTIGYDANADESRWLLDPSTERGFDKAFHDKVASLTDAPGLSVDAASNGLFGQTLRGATFTGEREAASAMIDAFNRYYLDDPEIRKLERAGKHADAVKLCLGDSNARFDLFDQALGKVVAIDEQEVDTRIEAEREALGASEAVVPAAALAIAALAWLGVRARLKEYA